jgi:hypothetical protein
LPVISLITASSAFARANASAVEISAGMLLRIHQSPMYYEDDKNIEKNMTKAITKIITKVISKIITRHS